MVTGIADRSRDIEVSRAYAARDAAIAQRDEALDVLREVERLLFYGENDGENGEAYSAHLDAVRAVLAKAGR